MPFLRRADCRFPEAARINLITGSSSRREYWFNQWLAAVLQPPHLAAMVAMVSPSDPFVEWPTGVPIPMDVSWHHFTSGHVLQSLDAVDWNKVHHHLPLLTMDEALRRTLPYWRDVRAPPARRLVGNSPLSEQVRPRARAGAAHLRLVRRRAGRDAAEFRRDGEGAATEEVRRSQKLLMGPWPHGVMAQPTKLGEVEFGPSAQIDLTGAILRWFDHWLKGIDTGLMSEPPVRIFVMGANRWRDEADWPPQRAQRVKIFSTARGGRIASLATARCRPPSLPAKSPAIATRRTRCARFRSSPSRRSRRSAAPTITARSSAAMTCWFTRPSR